MENWNRGSCWLGGGVLAKQSLPRHKETPLFRFSVRYSEDDNVDVTIPGMMEVRPLSCFLNQECDRGGRVVAVVYLFSGQREGAFGGEW